MGNVQTKRTIRALIKPNRIQIFLFFFLIILAGRLSAQPGNMVTYAGGTGNEKFQGILQLSNGTLLVGGQANNFDWLPVGLPSNTINNVQRYFSASTEGTGFILHLSADQQAILGLVRFPDNSIRDVYKIKTNSLPGQPTGDIFISGSRDTVGGSDGYYIARLNNNFINGLPTGVAYYKSVDARTRNGGGPSIHFPPGSESAQKMYQPWDVNSKGQILYATGADFSFDRTSINFMNRNGVDTLMDYFSVHNPNFTGVPASSFVNSTGNPAFDLKSSSLWFKYAGTGTPGAMRSYAQNLFNQVRSDENGNSGRKGAFPFDAFFETPQSLGGAPVVTTGPGYTGYSVGTGGGRWTGKIGGIVFDKRNSHFYIGMAISVSSVTSQPNLDDTEPALAAFSANGELKWWARLHKEDANRSSAQQQVENIDLDYLHNQVVVLGRTRGNSVNNFWKGNELTNKAGGRGNQNQITGSNSTSTFPDFFWLGKYDLTTGKINHSTYVGELEGTQTFTTPSANPNYDGFPDMNSSNFNLGTTLINQMQVDHVTGQVFVSGTAQRTMTTLRAYQKMLKPIPYQQGGGVAAIGSFLRVYNPSLDTIVYSTLMTGLWNPANGTSENTTIRSILPISGGLIFSGFHSGQGNDVQLLNRPSWGTDTRDNQTGLFGRLKFGPDLPPNQPDTITKPSDLCTGTEFTFSVPAVAGATSYKWVIEAVGWSGTSTTNSITLTRSANPFPGFLTVYAINAVGISLPRTTWLPSTANVNSPTGFTFPQSQCPNQTQTYLVNQVAGAVSYNWSIVGTGCESWTLSSNQTTSNSVSVTSGATIASPCSLQVVANGCGNSSDPVSFALPGLGTVPANPIFSTLENGICVNIPKDVSVAPLPDALGYTWTLSGTGFSGIASGTSFTVTAGPGATGGTLTVVAFNACGNSLPSTFNIADPVGLTLPETPSTIIGANSGFCSNDTLEYSVNQTPGLTYSWFTNGNTWQVLDPNSNTTRLFIPQIGGSGQAFLFVQAQNICGSSNPKSILIRRGSPDIPSAERIVPALDSGICVGGTVTFSINPTFTATSYEWTFPNGWTLNGPNNQNTVTITATAAAEPGFIKVKAFNACGYDSVQRLTPAIKTNSTTFAIEPAPGGVINLCSGSSRLAYIAGTFNGPVKTFQWLTPPGVFILNASNTDPSNDTVRISSTFDATSGPITVIMSGNECGVSTVNLSITPNPAPGQAVGPGQLCVNPTNQTYTIQSVAGALSYEFELVPASAGSLTITDTSVTVDWNDVYQGNANLRARSVSNCGPSLFGPGLEITLGLPAANSSNPASICAPGNVTFTATGATGGAQYNWYSVATGGTPIATNSGTLTIAVNSDTTLYVTITNGTCESGIRTPVTASVGGVPAAPTTQGDTICAAGIVNLQATGGPVGVVYNWYSSSTGGTPVFTGSTYSLNIAGNQTFYVSAASGSCESLTRTPVLAEIINNTIPPTATADTLCGPGVAELSATGGGTGVTYNWYSAATGGTILASGATFQPNVAATTSYFVGSSDGNCESTRTEVVVLLSNTLSAPTSSDIQICTSGPVNLTASGAGSTQTYEWFDSPSGSTVLFTGATYSIANLSSTDTFYVAISEGTCQSSRTRVIATVSPALPNATAEGQTLCGGGPVSLTATGATGGQTYTWYDAATGGSVLGTGSPYNFTASATTTVYVAITEGNCASPVRQAVLVTVNTPPPSPSSADVNRCGPGAVSLTATSTQPGAVFEWFNTQTGGTVTFTGATYSPNLSSTDTFYVQVQGLNGCNSPRIQVIGTIKPVPTAPAGTNANRCGPGSLDLTATGQATLNWYAAATGGTPLASGPNFTTPALTSTTSYFVSSTIDGCESGRTEVQAIVNPIPVSPTGGDVSRCGEGIVVLIASQVNGLPIDWYSTPTGGSALFTGTAFTTPSLAVTTSYFVSSTQNGCESNRTEIKAVISPATTSPTGTDVSRCGPGALDLSVVPSAGSQAYWYTQPTGGTAVFIGSVYAVSNQTATTTYYVSSFIPGCESPRIPVQAIIKPVPNTPNAQNVLKCGPGQVTLTATGQGELRWFDAAQGGTLLGTGSPFTTASLSTTTTLFVSSLLDGCESSSRPVVITIGVQPPSPAGDTVERCGPGTVTLQTSAPGVNAFKWYTALNGGSQLGTGSSLTIDIPNTKFVFVSSVGQDGCESPRTLCQVVIDQVPEPNVSADPEIIKAGETSQLSASGGGTYSWTPSSRLSSAIVANPIASPFVTTTYVVKVRFRSCEVLDSVTVQVESGVTEIPNVFTPNNDGIFDTWIIPGALSTPGNKLMIFNRWGSIVKEFNGYKNNWDGDNLPAGTYYYTYDDGKETKNGTITIVR